MSKPISLYGATWPSTASDVEIEMGCVRKGGKWITNGRECGQGLSFHYEQIRKLFWPKLDDHRWHRLIRDTIIENKCTVLAGPASSGKTHEAAWIFLLEYLIFPEETCVLVSSTDARGLRGRIWSEITMLWQEAREKYEWIPGNLLDSRFSILTDALDEDEFDRKARNYRKCIQGVPCRESATSGLLRYAGWKQKRMRLVADEAGQMSPEFINGITNLNSNIDFKCVILGNFKDPLDCLGKCAEPRDGWAAHMAPMKTDVWDTFFPLVGKCVNLIGFDSPNFDFPKKDPSDPDRYPYMIGEKRISEIETSFGRNSEQFMSYCWGSMKISTISNRVLTGEICEKNNCFDDVVWEGSPTIKVAGLDASWGGDRCPITVAEFGKDVSGKIVLKAYPPVIVPVSPQPGQDADYAIAEFCKDFCEERSIPPENFFHDSTGRGSLGTALARVWSAQCNPIEFGGVPSKRPVTLDYFWRDPKTGERRLKLACEHYSKFVTELWFSVRYCAEAGQLKNLPREVFEEFAMRIWEKVSGDRYEIESKSGTQSKPGMKQRTGRSPDLADSLAISVEGARLRGFQISKLANEQSITDSTKWFWDRQRKLNELRKQHALDHSV